MSLTKARERGREREGESEKQTKVNWAKVKPELQARAKHAQFARENINSGKQQACAIERGEY